MVKMLRQMGIFTLRLNSGKVRVRGGYMHLCPPGTGDILCWTKGRTLWLETKALKGVMRDKQIEFREMVTALGHEYYEIKSIDAGLDAVR